MKDVRMERPNAIESREVKPFVWVCKVGVNGGVEGTGFGGTHEEAQQKAFAAFQRAALELYNVEIAAQSRTRY